MNIQFQLHGIASALKNEVMDYAQKRFDHLDRFLKSFPEDDQQMTLTCHYEEKHTFFGMKSALRLGGVTLFHYEDTHDPREAIDKCEANLTLQVKKFIERLRGKKKASIRKMRKTVLRAKHKVS